MSALDAISGGGNMLSGLLNNFGSAGNNATSDNSGEGSNPLTSLGAPTDYLNNSGGLLDGMGGGGLLSGMGSGLLGGMGGGEGLLGGMGGGEGLLGGMGGGEGLLGGMGGGEMGSGGMDQSSPATGESVASSSEGSGVQPGKKPVVIISHGIGGSGGMYAGLARKFEQAGYHVVTPTDTGSPFDGSGAVDAYKQLAASNNPQLDLNNVILVGHSAGGAAAQSAAKQLGDKVAGVISIDGAPATGGTNTNVPHAFFDHNSDMLGIVVGNPNTSVPPNLRTQETLPGSHMTAMSGRDGEHYVQAANKMLGIQ